MGFKSKSTITPPKGTTFKKSVRIETEGEYNVTFLKARFVSADQKYGDRYFIDFTIDAGPDYVGEEASFAKFMREKYKNYVNPNTGATFTAKQQETADEEAVQIAYAAALGLDAENAGQLGEGGTHEGLLELAFDKGDSSAIKDRKGIVIARADKKGYINLTVLPVNDSTPVAAPAKPKTPPPVASKKTFLQAVSIAGFEERADAPGWFLNSETEEQLDEEDLRKKLGY